MYDNFDEIIKSLDCSNVVREPLKGWIETAKLTVGNGRRHYAYIKYDNGNGIMHDTLTGKPLDCGFYEPEYIDAPKEVLPDCVRLRFMLVYKLGENYADIDKVIGPASNAILAVLAITYVWRLWTHRDVEDAPLDQSDPDEEVRNP